jgi:hypothetical protein
LLFEPFYPNRQFAPCSAVNHHAPPVKLLEIHL